MESIFCWPRTREDLFFRELERFPLVVGIEEVLEAFLTTEEACVDLWCFLLLAFAWLVEFCVVAFAINAGIHSINAKATARTARISAKSFAVNTNLRLNFQESSLPVTAENERPNCGVAL